MEKKEKEATFISALETKSPQATKKIERDGEGGIAKENERRKREKGKKKRRKSARGLKRTD